MEKLLQGNMGLILKLMSLDLTPQEMKELKDLADSANSPPAKAFFSLVADLKLIDETSRQENLQALLEDCNLDRLNIR